jgi:hypothetical protein
MAYSLTERRISDDNVRHCAMAFARWVSGAHILMQELAAKIRQTPPTNKNKS